MLNKFYNIIICGVTTYVKIALENAKSVFSTVLGLVAGKIDSKKIKYSFVKKICIFSLSFAFAVMFVGGVADTFLRKDHVGVPVPASTLPQQEPSNKTETVLPQLPETIAVEPNNHSVPLQPKTPDEKPLQDNSASESVTDDASSTQQSQNEAEDEHVDQTYFTPKAMEALREQEHIAAQSGSQYSGGGDSGGLSDATVQSDDKDVEQVDLSIEEPDEEPSVQAAAAQNPAQTNQMGWTQPANASVASLPGGFNYSDKVPMSYELQAYTYNKCVERGLEYQLILAIIWRESRFQTNAVNVNTNGTRDSGIMQINDVNRGWLYEQHGIDNLMDPYQNIDAGTAMLGSFTSKYGSHYALLAYQFGEEGMKAKVKQGQITNKLVDLVYVQRDYYRQFV